jgi:tripartite-type tricarboxylate transporter receptor subunit TctC
MIALLWLSVPKIRFCNNGDEVRRGRARYDAAHVLDGAMRVISRGVAETPMWRITHALVVVAALLAITPTYAQSVAEFYAGKQITLIVGASTGGGYDTQARLVARHLGKHIPGNPTIIVQNMPAAGSLAAANHIYNVAAKDGSVFALVMRGMLLIKHWSPASARFDLGHLNWIGSINSEVAVAAAWHTAPHKTVKDLFDKELIVGGTTGVDPETTPRLFNALLGTKFKIVNGYPGTTEIILAMERGEVQGIGDWSWSSMKTARPDWLRDRKMTLLMQAALQKDPELPDVPSALEFVKNDADRKVMELYLTQKTVARPVIAPPGVPAERLAALRAGFIALAQDKEFIADAQKARLEVAPISGEAVDKVISLITSASPETGERLSKAIAPVK